jgi:protein PhnA
MRFQINNNIKISMINEPKCPKCNSENTYQDMNLWICPECFYEWDSSESEKSDEEESSVATVRDSNGNILQSGDSVTTIKDLKVKGSPSGIKAGTKVKNITLIDGHDGHNISCKVDGIGAMYLKSEFVKKA